MVRGFIVALMLLAGNSASASEEVLQTPSPPWALLWSESVMVERSAGALGGGTLIAPGLVLTVQHVVGDEPQVTLHSALGTHTVGRVLVADPVADLALVEFDSAALPSLHVAPFRCGDVDDSGFYASVGHPFGRPFVVQSTELLSAEPQIPDKPLVQLMTGPAIPGMSGGGVFDPHSGELLAVSELSVGRDVGGWLGVISAASVCQVLPAAAAVGQHLQ